VSQCKSLADAIDQFQTEQQELALVIADGDVVGQVTVMDLLETIIGDIQDPLDEGEGEGERQSDSSIPDRAGGPTSDNLA
jgi:CBS domain containing-hemolysin-like protein